MITFKIEEEGEFTDEIFNLKIIEAKKRIEEENNFLDCKFEIIRDSPSIAFSSYQCRNITYRITEKGEKIGQLECNFALNYKYIYISNRNVK